ncbi:zinc-binding alcohol dehydrogenase family protein [Treponema brennaborense]|uniref:L-threonine 3-dehydrogenase n=1 Tax=Treponema brennaborense (strain DSM 12168 / CIP 105900 / DD5/3) TaxID=906968 RepID=F4LKT9_TREBD|nr:zinc-binding alcohol dehydrogenase family protein [Treponema brennaborense]AEE15550.1 L-threonine 3-dehydrogenase [Treponema brennaborense DSM 12168]
MKAVQIVKPGELQVIDMEEPVLNAADNVLIKMTAAGICGSDVGIYHGTNAAATYPRIIGHEMVGRVVRTGPGVTAVKPGDRVIVNQVTSCGTCYPCRKGRGNVCDRLKVRGVHIDGGYREYIAVPESDCYVLPDSVSDADAVMIEPTTIAIQSCTRAELVKDDMLLLFGSGALGSSILKIARLRCDTIIVADVVESKLEAARKNGATRTINVLTEDLTEKVKEYTDGHGATVSIDAVCSADSLLKLLEATGNAGRVITMGFSTAATQINQFVVTSKELDVRGSRLQNRMFGKAIDLIVRGELDLNGSVSHTFALADAQKAFDFIDSHDPSIRKIVLTFDE